MLILFKKKNGKQTKLKPKRTLEQMLVANKMSISILVKKKLSDGGEWWSCYQPALHKIKISESSTTYHLLSLLADT